MSSRRIVAAVIAGVLTLVAALILIAYVGGADSRAASKLDPVPVLVVVSPIPKGTAGDALRNAVQLKEVPKTAIAQGAVTNVAELGDRVTSVNLVPGEQVLASRFIDPASLQSVSIPKGLQEVSIMLTAQKVYGGQPVPGDKVGMFLASKGINKLVLNDVLITRVQSAAAAAPSSGGGGLGGGAPAQAGPPSDSNVMVTFALNTHDAERVIWTAENGTIWLSLENSDTNTSGSSAVSADNFNK